MCGSSSTISIRRGRPGGRGRDEEAGVTCRSRLEQAGDGRAMAAEVEKKPAYVRGGLDEHDQQSVGGEDGHHAEPPPELQDCSAEVAARAGLAELRQRVDGG